MDLISVITSAVLSAVVFLILEFSIILPLFSRVVKKSVSDIVDTSVLPSMTAFVDDKITGLKSDLVDSLVMRIRGSLGGKQKGVNRVLQRLANGENLEDIEDQYQESTIEQVLTIVSAVASRLPGPSKEVNENGKEKENNQIRAPQEGELLTLGSSQEGQA